MTRAVTIAELGDTNVFSVDGTNNRVGIGSTQPTVKLDVNGVVVATAFTGDGAGLTGVANTDIISSEQITVSGVVTATSFVGDGSQITGVSGFATALSSDSTNILNKVFKTPVTLEIASDTTVNSDAASDFHAFVRLSLIHISEPTRPY